MATQRVETLQVRSSEEIVQVRQAVRAWAAELGFSLVDQTKIVTAASELARNTVLYGGGGSVLLEMLNSGTAEAYDSPLRIRGPAFRISTRP